MIYELSRDIGDLLAAKKFPYRVDYTQRHQPRGGGPRIEFRRERGPNADQVEGPIGARNNPNNVATRWLGAEARIYAQSTLKGAHDGDHEAECERVVDGLMAALHYWTKAAKAAIRYNESRYLESKEVDDTEKWAGVVYLVRFSVARGVSDRDYTGAARPTGTIGSIGSTTHVRYEGRPDSDPAIGCGEDP